MKILISTDASSALRDNPNNRNAWGVDRILVWGTDINDSLDSLPPNVPGLTILVPTILNRKNALSYDGATLAMRILFRYIYNYRNGINIVLLGTESLESFLCHFSYPNIIKIPGLHYCLRNRQLVASIDLPTNNITTRKQYSPYLSQLGINLPASFKTTHSLTNEWCLYKWNDFMGFSDAADDDNLNLLYFDYLKALEKVKDVRYRKLENNIDLKKEILSLKETSMRILLIDDNPRWQIFFEKFFLKSKVKFDAIGHNYKKFDLARIMSEITEKVTVYNPDVILLDFRLLEDRDADCRFEDISGTQILSMLKGSFDKPGVSYGRQILIFTATSRIENVLRLKALNADGFILKEKASLYSGKEDTKVSLSNMVGNIIRASERAKFLIPLNDKFDLLTDIVTVNSVIIGEKVAKHIKSAAESIRLITQNNEINEGVLKLMYLDIFNIFESINRDSGLVNYPNDFSLIIYANKALRVCTRDRSSIYQKSAHDWNCIHALDLSSQHNKYCKEKSLKFAMCALILFRLGCKQVDDTEWNNIRAIRNAIAHGESNQLYKRKLDLSSSTLKYYVLEMLDLLSRLLDSKYIQEVEPNLSN